uniref:Uncharacterized protein n=1 Tax=Anopheles dirus TaxID=7168 RepID=A0A182NFY1_9DIPT
MTNPVRAKYVQSTNGADATPHQAHGIDPQDADLVLSTLRHQRDLFSGPLGIPDVTTRVGSVIHAFETMARQRQSLGGRESYHGRADKPYDTMATAGHGGGGGGGSSKYRSHRSNVKRVGDANRHKIILPSPKISPSPSAEAGQFYHGQPHFPHHPADSPHHPVSQHGFPTHHHHHLPPASFSYTDPRGVGPGVVRRYGGGSGAHGEENMHISSNNFEPNLPHSAADHNNHIQTLPGAMFPAVALSVSGTNTITAGGDDAVDTGTGDLPHFQLTNENESSNFDSLNLDDDYRKSSFGKQSKLLHQPQHHQQLLQRRGAPSNVNTLLLARAQQSTDSTANRTSGRGLWSLFGAGGGAGNASDPSSHNHHTATTTTTPGYSTSRNNPNVFFNVTSTAPPPTESAATTSIASPPPLHQLSTASASNSAVSGTTMRYYNHDNTINSANRRSLIAASPFEGGPAGASPTPAADDVPDRRNEPDTGIANEGNDNEAIDNHVSGDKFLRGTTVSQSFIKNVRIIGKKSSSYDVSGASGASAAANNNHNHTRKDSKRRVEAPPRTTGDGAGTSSSSNGFKQRGSLMMAAAAKHFTKRNRAPPQPGAAASIPVTNAPAEDVANNNNETGAAAGKGSGAPARVRRLQQQER